MNHNFLIHLSQVFFLSVGARAPVDKLEEIQKNRKGDAPGRENSTHQLVTAPREQRQPQMWKPISWRVPGVPWGPTKCLKRDLWGKITSCFLMLVGEGKWRGLSHHDNLDTICTRVRVTQTHASCLKLREVNNCLGYQGDHFSWDWLVVTGWSIVLKLISDVFHGYKSRSGTMYAIHLPTLLRQSESLACYKREVA